MNHFRCSTSAVLGLLVSLSGCKRDTSFEDGQRDSDDAISAKYVNTYNRDQFLERANRDLDPLLNEFWQAFSVSPTSSQNFESETFHTPSAQLAIRAFIGQSARAHRPQLESIDDFANITFNALTAKTPDPKYTDIREGDSCESAMSKIDTGYSRSIDYAKKIIHAANVTDDNALPEGVSVIEDEDFAKHYRVSLNAKNETTSTSGNYDFVLGGDKNVLDVQAKGNLNFSELSAQRDETVQTEVYTRLKANTTSKSMDLITEFKLAEAYKCPSQMTKRVESVYIGTYYSTIALGKEPKIVDGLYSKQKNKYGYTAVETNQDCPQARNSRYKNLSVGGIFQMVVTKPSANELHIEMVDLVGGKMDTQAIEDTIKTEWTLVNDGSSCTVSRVVQAGQDVP